MDVNEAEEPATDLVPGAPSYNEAMGVGVSPQLEKSWDGTLKCGQYLATIAKFQANSWVCVEKHGNPDGV